MIEILVHGNLKRVKCQKCGALLQYDEKEDMKEECIEIPSNLLSGAGYKQK